MRDLIRRAKELENQLAERGIVDLKFATVPGTAPDVLLRDKIVLLEAALSGKGVTVAAPCGDSVRDENVSVKYTEYDTTGSPIKLDLL